MGLIHSDFKFQHDFYTGSYNTNELQSIKNELFTKQINKTTNQQNPFDKL